MKLTEKDILQGMKDLRLTDAKRALMRSELSAYADLHAMPSAEKSSFNSIAFLGNIFAHSRVLVASSLALILVVTGGSATAFAAEKAVPGEVLYGVKVLVNEPVAGVFAGTGAGRARHHARLAVRRVAEAEVLDARGELTAPRALALAERFEEESGKAEAEATRLESAGDVSASIAIRTELATNLDAQVEAPTEDSAVALAVTATAAPALMKASAEVARDTIIRSEKEAFRALVVSRVARLREHRGAPRAVGIPEDEDESSADDELAEIEDNSETRSLLSGSSVVSSGLGASTTATSSPAERKRLLKALLRIHKNTPDAGTAEEAEDRTLEAPSLIEPIINPARLVPRSSIPSE